MKKSDYLYGYTPRHMWIGQTMIGNERFHLLHHLLDAQVEAAASVRAASTSWQRTRS